MDVLGESPQITRSPNFHRIKHKGETKMTNATLAQFRAIAETMAGDEAQDWQWIGPHMSQRMFGISERRANAYAERHGCTAKQMTNDR
jgi:hypothetical protein